MTAYLLNDLIDHRAAATPEATALIHRDAVVNYAGLAALQDGFAAGVAAHAAPRARVGIWLTKSPAMVAAAFGTAKAGCAFVPINPVLKAQQVGHILADCAVEILVTSPERLVSLAEVIAASTSIRLVVVLPAVGESLCGDKPVIGWDSFCACVPAPAPSACPVAQEDVAAIFYTSGSTGWPKGVVVPHRSLVTGARAVAEYLDQRAEDRLLGVMPLSFDAGFSQLTTAFLAGAACVLMDYAHPAEVIGAIRRHRITGLTAVPPLLAQLVTLDWPPNAATTLRYWATTGGRMPQAVIEQLRSAAPQAKPYLMYGLTEAFRSTYLPPEDLDRKQGSIGRAIPGQAVDVRRPDGTLCDPHEVGELVHRGSTVTLGYWNNPEATAARFGWLAPAQPEIPLRERAVFSGDQAWMDEEGYIFFVGRNDEMIKSLGNRISPVEIEEAVHAGGLVEECAAFGIEDEVIGHRIGLVARVRSGITQAAVREVCRQALPGFMVPHEILLFDEPLARNPNGKIDRRAIAVAYAAHRVRDEEKAA